MAVDRFGRNRPQTFPDWCDTGKQSFGGLRHTMDHKKGIVWSIKNDAYLPHYDHIEMTGFNVSGIISYGVDETGLLRMNRHIVFPSLRMIPNETRGSLTHNFPSSISSFIKVNGQKITKEYPYSIEINGFLTINSRTETGVLIRRTLFPAMDQKAFIERFDLVNMKEQLMSVEIISPDYSEATLEKESLDGYYFLEASIHGEYNNRQLKPGETMTVYCVYSARKANEHLELDVLLQEQRRTDFIAHIDSELVLETPSEVINMAFKMTKRRCSESIFQTKRGLMHAPGGGDYYAALWTNDQCEYVNPLFPFLGYEQGIEQSISTYKLFMTYMKEDFSMPLVSSIVAEGDSYWNGVGDRGDAAMFAYGALRFALAYGSEDVATALWPGIKWSIDYSLHKMNSDGVVESDTDELENRFESGEANLFTSCLLYDALNSMAYMVESLKIEGETPECYREKADALAAAIEDYFGRSVEGYETYQYYKGNKILRSWICMPLVVGIRNRVKGTIAALFSERLWTDNGLRTEAGEETFWDRSTLFALRGVFVAGAPDRALTYLESYTKVRLLGEHVPYPVEAYPEGNQRHLAGESALYVRIITEGIFGIRPTGFHSFDLKPQLPITWRDVSLKNVHICQRIIDIEVHHDTLQTHVVIRENGQIIVDEPVDCNGVLSVNFRN